MTKSQKKNIVKKKKTKLQQNVNKQLLSSE